MTNTRICEYCGGEHSGKSVYCSSGCDLANRLPLGEESLPATWQLSVLLGWGFALFNQVLFVGVSVLSESSYEFERAGKFAVAALIFGSLVFVWHLFLLLIAGSRNLSDYAILLGLSLVAILGLTSSTGNLSERIMAVLLIANLLFSLWLTRGLWHIRSLKKKQNR